MRTFLFVSIRAGRAEAWGWATRTFPRQNVAKWRRRKRVLGIGPLSEDQSSLVVCKLLPQVRLFVGWNQEIAVGLGIQNLFRHPLWLAKGCIGNEESVAFFLQNRCVVILPPVHNRRNDNLRAF